MAVSNNFNPLHLALLLSLLAFQSLALNSDGIVLLSFKYAVLDDPLSVLDSWSYDDVTPCSWTGVSCTKSEVVGSKELMRVTSLILPNTQLSGSVSPDLSLISTLQELDLSGNSFKGSLPLSILHAADLQKLNLADNNISGEIPALIGILPNLKLLNLSGNALAGKIPGGFEFVEVLDLSSNSLTGSVPVNFDGGKLNLLDLSRNKLSGSIPPQFALNIPGNATVDLSFNNFTGEIPKMLSLLNQKSEAFAGNAGLCGKPLPLLCSIPSTLSIPPELNSSTPAIAVIPKIISSDPALEAPGSSDEGRTGRMQPMAIAGIIVGDIAGLGLLAFLIFFVHQLKNRKTDKPSPEQQPATLNPMKKIPDTHQITIVPSLSPSPDHNRRFSAWLCLTGKGEAEISECTSSDADQEHLSPTSQNRRNGVLVSVDETVLEMETLLKSSAYVLGTSNSSIVYKTVMQNGTAFAVRRIGDGCVKKMKDFETQIKATAKLRHPNLVRTLGFYWGEDEKLVIYDFIPNGSLASAISRKQGTSAIHLNLDMRLRIARGVARGLASIHEKKHIHGNIKPSNILLDSNFEPVISDLGLDRLIPKPRSDQFTSMRSHASREGLLDTSAISGGGSPYAAAVSGSALLTSSPYYAPESLNNPKPSPKWDVYSFGVVLLELLTWKALHCFDLEPWTEAVEEPDARVLRMADVAIRNDVAVREDATLACFKLGFRCANLAPSKRPTMKEAVQVLEKVMN